MDKELEKKLEENGTLMRVRTGISDLLESSLSIIQESLETKNRRPIFRSIKEYEFIELLARLVYNENELREYRQKFERLKEQYLNGDYLKRIK